MHRSSNRLITREQRGGRVLRAAAAGALAAAILGVGAQSALGLVTVRIGAANNVYPAMQELATHLAGSTITPLTYNTAGQNGGWWNPASVDTTLLRGITSGNMRKQLIGAGAYTTPGAACSDSTNVCQYGPLSRGASPDVNAFFSADESNVDQVIPSGSTQSADSTTAASCVDNSTTAGMPIVTECPGEPATETAFVIGDIAIYSCDSDFVADGADPGTPDSPTGAVAGSGNGQPASPRCEGTQFGGTPGSPTPPTTMSGLLTWLTASANNQMSIALPSSAPFGAASRDAIIQAGYAYNDSTMAGADNAMVASTCDSSGTACKIRLEAGISQVRGAVTSNSVPIGLVAVSNVKKIKFTSGTLNGTTTQDPNPWTIVPQTDYPNPIKQFGVQIDSADNAADTKAATMVTTTVLDSVSTGVFVSYGYAAP